MKGIVFNLLEDFVTDSFGLAVWEDTLKKAKPSSGNIFVAPKTYPDTDFLALVTTAVEENKLDLGETVRAFGVYSIGQLIERYPNLIEPYKTAKDFICSVDSLIHMEVKKLFSESQPPRLAYKELGPNQLQIEYHSARKLCVFMEGMLAGVAKHYGVEINVKQLECSHQGAPYCLFQLDFS